MADTTPANLHKGRPPVSSSVSDAAVRQRQAAHAAAQRQAITRSAGKVDQAAGRAASNPASRQAPAPAPAPQQDYRLPEGAAKPPPPEHHGIKISRAGAALLVVIGIVLVSQVLFGNLAGKLFNWVNYWRGVPAPQPATPAPAPAPAGGASSGTAPAQGQAVGGVILA